jgi:hypothetical protein
MVEEVWIRISDFPLGDLQVYNPQNFPRGLPISRKLFRANTVKSFAQLHCFVVTDERHEFVSLVQNTVVCHFGFPPNSQFSSEAPGNGLYFASIECNEPLCRRNIFPRKGVDISA